MRAKFSLPLPSKVALPNADYPLSRAKGVTALTASERLPLCLARARNRPALYRFLIYRGHALERIYVGETKHFATRMGQYCGMIRRLLLLAIGCTPVTVEKHPFRLVQFFVAAALLGKNPRVYLDWTYLPSNIKKLDRETLERTEQQRARGRLRPWHVIDGKRDGNFENGPRPSCGPWDVVHGRLLALPARKKLRPPFLVN
jgi:hypothetical protein